MPAASQTDQRRNVPQSRMERAQEIAASGGIVRNGSEFLVPSLTSDSIYRVRLADGGEVTCTCKGFRFGKGEPCSHCLACAISTVESGAND